MECSKNTHSIDLILAINLINKKALLPVLIAIASLFSAGVSAGEITNHQLEWHKPFSFPVNESEYVEVLYFENAVFGDSFPELPMFSLLSLIAVPHFKHEYSLFNKEYIKAGDREQEILRELNFFRERIHLEQQIQSAARQRYSVLSFYPFIYDAGNDTYYKLDSFSLNKEQFFDPDADYTVLRTYTENSVLASGNWYKVCVDETGIYRLSHTELQALGIEMASLLKQNIRLFGNGGGMLPELNSIPVHDDLIENAIYVSGSQTGSFGQDDYILFYGQSPDVWHFDEAYDLFRYERHLYSDRNCYFITTDQGPGKRIDVQAETAGSTTHQINSFRDMAVHQRDLVNLLNSGRVWFGEVFDATLSRQFSFDFPHLEPNAPATVEAYVAARAPVLSTFTVTAGGRQKNLPVAPINPTQHNTSYVYSANDTMQFTPASQSSISINLNYNRPASGTRGWLNYIVVNATRQLRFTGEQMTFRNVQHVGEQHVHEYLLDNAGSQVSIWDVSDIFNVKLQDVSMDGNRLRFKLSGDHRREFVAFDGSSFLTAELIGHIPNQNLHGMTAKDLIIVSPVEFMEEAERLAAFREEHSGLTAAVVSTAQVYNEFSSGKQDVSAIRNFMKMFYDRAASAYELPRYLLLFGNGSVDNSNLLGYGGSLIPTFQSLASYSPRLSYMTDDYFGILDDHEGEDAIGVPDLGIGRLPVRNAEEAAMMVDKIIRYEKRIPGMAPGANDLAYTGVVSNYADWRNIVVFIADDGDDNEHFDHAEILANSMFERQPQYNLQKIYLDAYQQITMAGGARYPEVNRAINERVNQGALMINYIGHGETRGLAHQRVVTIDDIAGWNNKYNMPVFMTATCEFSSFDQPDPENLSAGVRVLLKNEGGTAGLFTTTRLAWSGHNLILNRNFMEAAFANNKLITLSHDKDDQHPNLGDLIRIAKQKSSSGGTTPRQLRNFVLLGDPSMQMAYPEFRVVTENMPDTIRAFQEVTITGHVTDLQGNMVHDYNGVLFPTIYDKKTVYKTLGNNPDSNPAEFSLRNSILYKGKASIENGRFSFQFMVPKDIAYEYGSGKISYYLDDGVTDGHGHFQDFIIGGTADDFQADLHGPDIELFMNDTTFASGAYTNENPILLAHLFDESGINLTGSIGHDISAFLNDDFSSPIRLNNYFEADLDSYQSGRVIYPFRRLDEGRYTLTLRAWDIHNNPATATIDFVVSSSGQLVLEHLMNYPNPFAYDTWFTFSHNQAFSELDVRIDIYDLQGRLVNTIKERVFPVGFQSTPIHWDGLSNDGRPLVNGLYIYRITMTTPEGMTARQAEKLMIFR